MPLPSEISFCSLLRYSPRGESEASAMSRRIMRAAKSDSYVGEHRIIPFAARRISELITSQTELQKCFGDDVVLVPVPRSAPLVPGGLWPAMRLAEELVAANLAGTVHPWLERAVSVRKSATADPKHRPTPDEHYRSFKMTVEPSLSAGGRVCLVDDVVTRGATLLAAAGRVQDTFPQSDVHAFALIRTVSEGDVDSPLDPMSGAITMTQGQTRRRP